jgi:hypothetical protein
VWCVRSAVLICIHAFVQMTDEKLTLLLSLFLWSVILCGFCLVFKSQFGIVLYRIKDFMFSNTSQFFLIFVDDWTWSSTR